MVYAQFYEYTKEGSKLVPSIDFKGVLMLDNTKHYEVLAEYAANVCEMRGYTAYSIIKGHYRTGADQVTGIIYV